MKITAEAVRERIAALEAAGELSLKEQFYLDALRALLPGLAEPVTRFDAVADLYALKTLAGQTYNYTASPHEAEQWLGTEGYSVQEYVKLERLQQAVTAPPAQGGTDYKAIVERIAEILHGKVTDIDLLTVTVQAMKERNSKLERQREAQSGDITSSRKYWDDNRNQPSPQTQAYIEGWNDRGAALREQIRRAVAYLKAVNDRNEPECKDVLVDYAIRELDGNNHRSAAPAPVVPKIDRKAICNKVHWLCARSPGATFYNAAEYALDEVIELLAPPAPVDVPNELVSELLDIAKRAAEEADECANAEFSDNSMKHAREIAEWERRAAMLAAPTHVATSEVTQDFKPVSRKKCRKCDQEVFGYTVNGLCEDCYSAAPVVPAETFEEWSRRCEIQLTLCRPEFREVAEITWKACRDAMLAAPGKQPLSVDVLAGALRNAPLAPSDNHGRKRAEDDNTGQQYESLGKGKGIEQ